ncbi:CoA-binding protein [Magnetofaba australis]|uniref:Putative CoA-binding domain-containing protein n=1 Tax=Magnetofaba australis IT-1 TaxID=1434232 RepID=A0A1Y2K388_9PROT|nr:CoA-binding protein [Magnetofaba australis]OSM01624.1 putative CoA-binding domain-containing protein [Magnetofaba australis IT-1]
MDDAQMIDLLKQTKTIAVVGLSPKPERASHRVAAYLKEQGYVIIPVRPGSDEVLGEKAYPSLEAIPSDIVVDMVDVFRKSEDTPDVVRSAAAIKAKSVWLQKEIAHPESARIASEAGMAYVEDHCLMVEHRRLADQL